MLKRVGNVLVFLWMCIVNVCRKFLPAGNRRKTHTQQSISQISQHSESWTADWDGWEGVKIEDTSPKQESPLTETSEDVPDLFKDMEPCFHKPKKIKVKATHRTNQRPNLKQFAFDPTFQNTTSELLDWPDEEQEVKENDGWDKEELPELLRQSRQVLRQQKLEAMEEQRRLLQQQRNSGGSLLGATKIT